MVNAQSLVANIDKCEILINDYEPEIFCVVETRTTTDITDGELNIYGYQMLRSNSTSRHSGGVVVYFKDVVKVVFVAEFTFGYNNILICDVNNTELKGRWIVIYHSPNYPHALFIQKLNEILESYGMVSRSLYVIGDMNINFAPDNTAPLYKNELSSLMNSYGLKQIVQGYTRVYKDIKTRIDLCFTNDLNCNSDVTDKDMVADHKTIIIRKKCKQKIKNFKTITDRKLLTKDNILSKIRVHALYPALSSTDLTNAAMTLDSTLG